jgi:hypothetical protein
MCDRQRRAVCGVIALAGALAACHSTPVDTRPPIEERLGVYRFTQHVTATGAESIDIEGRFVVFGDTVTVEAQPGPCRLDTRIAMPNPFTYDCGGVTLTFDRLDPAGHAMYSVMLSVTQTRTVCVRYATDPSGRRYCAEQRTEPSQRQVKQTGYLRVTRVTR